MFLEDRVGDISELQEMALTAATRPDLIVINQLHGLYRRSRKGAAIYSSGDCCMALSAFARRNRIAVLTVRPDLARCAHFPCCGMAFTGDFFNSGQAFMQLLY